MRPLATLTNGLRKPAHQVDTPAILAARLDRLRFDPHDPSIFLAERDELAREIRMLAVPASPRVVQHLTADPRIDERVRRLAALLAASRAELAKLRRLLASARPKQRVQRRVDTRAA